jgi:WD40 repeat protein
VDHPLSLLALGCLLLASAGQSGAAAADRVYAKDGNVFIELNGAARQLTTTGRDAEPVLSPDGKHVVFTRLADRLAGDDQGIGTDCDGAAQSDEIREIDADGSDETLLVHGHAAKEPQEQLCGFQAKQFNADGSRLFFLSAAWATSAALHVYDLGTRTTRFVLPANDLLVLTFCKDEYRDGLAVEQHRYFVFGGSYDWYWLYDATGEKEIGPLGEFEKSEDVVTQARDMCES